MRCSKERQLLLHEIARTRGIQIDPRRIENVPLKLWTSKDVNNFIEDLLLSEVPQVNLTGSELANVDDKQLERLGFSLEADRKKILVAVHGNVHGALDSIEQNVRDMLDTPSGSGPKAVRSLRSRPKRTSPANDVADKHVQMHTQKMINSLLESRGLM